MLLGRPQAALENNNHRGNHNVPNNILATQKSYTSSVSTVLFTDLVDDAYPGVYVNCDVLLDIVDDAMQYIVDQGLPPHDVYMFLLFYICSIQMLTNKDTGKIFLMYVLISINYWLVSFLYYCLAFLVNLVVVICFCLFIYF